MTSSITEIRLINRILRRDQSALSELYARYGARVYGIALRVLNNGKLAEEATQDTFLKIWNNAQHWDIDRGSLSTWIMTVTRYTAIDVLRREKRQNLRTTVELEAVMSFVVDESAQHAFEQFDANFLRSLIERLPSDQIEAIELAFFKGMSHSEIAAHLNIPLGTIKSRIRNGLQTLRGFWLREIP